MAHSAGACLIMDVLSAGDQKNGFPKGCHLFGGDGRQAGTTTITEGFAGISAPRSLRPPIRETRVHGGIQL